MTRRAPRSNDAERSPGNTVLVWTAGVMYLILDKQLFARVHKFPAKEFSPFPGLAILSFEHIPSIRTLWPKISDPPGRECVHVGGRSSPSLSY